MLRFSFERPEWLWLLLIVPVAIGAPLLFRSMASLPAMRRYMALTVRALLLVAIILAIAGTEWVRENRNLAVAFVVDRSRSIPDPLRLAQETFLREVNATSNRPRDDKALVITFDGKSNIEQLPMRGVFVDRLTAPGDPDHTDLARAIRMAMATFPEGMARRIVLLSDGNENAGDALTEVAVASGAGVGVDVIPMRYDYENEVVFERLVVPAGANRGDRVPVRLILRSNRSATGTVVLYHNDQRIGATHETLKPGITSLVRELTLNAAGVHRFEARFEPDRPDQDSVARNNVARGFTVVQGQGSVLLVTSEPPCDAPLEAALKKGGVDARMLPIDSAPDDLLGLLEHDAIVLANIAADRFTEDQKKLLAAYVRDMGGGLIMTGGNEGFGAGGWLGSPVEDVMPLKFDVKQRKQIYRGALVLILHTCEMPQGNYWAEEIAIASVRTLSTMDYFGLIAFGYQGGTQWEIPFGLASGKEGIITQIRKISNRIGDMPDFGTSMEMAYQVLKQVVDAAQKHIIIVSDGDASAPSSSLLSNLKNAQITCTTVGIGFGAHVMEQTLKDIAEATGGRYYAVKDPQKLPQIFVKEAKVVRRPLIREAPEGFKPRLRSAMPEITAGLTDADLPPLMGHVLTTPRSTASEFSHVLMVSDKEDPLLAVRQCELGRSVAFTGGWWLRWGQPWLTWDKFDRLWAQTLRWAMRQAQEADFEVSTRVTGDEGRIVVEAVDKDAAFLNGLSIAGSVLSPDLKSRAVRLEQTGPGRYEGRFPVSGDGHYVAALNYQTPRNKRGSIRTGVSVSYSPEYRDLGTNETLLSLVADRAGGKVLEFDPLKANVFRRPVKPSVQRMPIWSWIVGWWVIPLLLTDVATRRLASTVAISLVLEALVLIWLLGAAGLWASGWGWCAAILIAEAIGWAVRWRSIPRVIEAVTSELRGLRTSEAAEQSVTRLKTVREKIREELAERATTPASEQAADATTRFDAGQTDHAPVGDLDQLMGGAGSLGSADDASTASDKAGQTTEGQQGESTTSRLLRAKRRAKTDRPEDRR